MAGTLGLQNQWSMFPKYCNFENWSPTEKLFQKYILPMPQSTCPECLPLSMPKYPQPFSHLTPLPPSAPVKSTPDLDHKFMGYGMLKTLLGP